jgi:hypothetical protein
MASKKTLPTAGRPTIGTIVADKNRAKMNGLGDGQRAALLARGMQLIHGAVRPAKTVAAGRR